MKSTTKVFISYAQDQSNGQDLAKLVQEKINDIGYKTFRDETSILPGTRWVKEIEEQLKTCNLMVLIMSEKTSDSDWVFAEFQYAQELAIPIIPLKSEDMLTPLWLRSLQILDFSEKKDWGRLIEAIDSNLLTNPSIPVDRNTLENFPSIIEISHGIEGSILDSREFYKKSLSSLSNDGELLLLANNNDVVVINIAENTLTHTLNGHTSNITACSFSTDGGKIASASDDGVIKLWDTESGECIATYEGPSEDHDNTINHCVFSPDGDLLLTTGNYSTHLLWNISTGECVERFHGFHLWSYLVKFSPDGELILTTNKLGNIELWNIEKKDWIQGLHEVDEYGPSMSGTASGCSFSPNSRMIASISNGAISIWGISTAKKIKEITTSQNDILVCAFSNDNDSIISLSEDGLIETYDITSRRCKSTQNIGMEILYSYGFSNNINYIFFEDKNYDINIWSISEAKIILKIIKQDSESSDNSASKKLLIY